jgi:hypothetical protein
LKSVPVERLTKSPCSTFDFRGFLKGLPPVQESFSSYLHRSGHRLHRVQFGLFSSHCSTEVEHAHVSKKIYRRFRAVARREWKDFEEECSGLKTGEGEDYTLIFFLLHSAQPVRVLVKIGVSPITD